MYEGFEDRVGEFIVGIKNNNLTMLYNGLKHLVNKVFNKFNLTIGDNKKSIDIDENMSDKNEILKKCSIVLQTII